MLPEADPNSPDVVYQHMRWNTPLSESHAHLLLERLGVESGDVVVDLGCGWGQLLIQAVAKTPTSLGIGVDKAEWALARGRTLAIDHGVSDRITFVAQDASSWGESADRVLCIGASHAWGGTSRALRGLLQAVRPGGRVLYGDGCWEQPPTTAASQLFGEGILSLSGLVDEAIDAGWRILHLSSADQREWDEFESTWRMGRENWLLSNSADRRVPEVRAELDERLREYLTVYRGLLGFVYLVLAH
jgi:cyclopropane fatty-acyl-phospholipid synthase-like methyltransferase